jgi:predicted RNA-binding Zn-ribbon protein involved in translation (DUF1610 family)
MPDITSASLVSAEDGQGLTSHPDAILKSGESWVCSCGTTRVSLTTIKITVFGVTSEQATHTWCPQCGDVARWEPSHSAETPDGDAAR